MQFDELKLLPGTRMKLVLAGADLKHQTVAARYIGCHAPSSLLVAVPSRSFGVSLRPGVRIAVSVAVATGIASFTSVVETTATAPYGYMHLLYPREVVWRAVRAAVRVAASLPVEVRNAGTAAVSNGRILDMSVRGLKLGASEELGRIGDELDIRVVLVLDDIERQLSLQGRVRSRLVGEGADTGLDHIYGVELYGLSDDGRILLQAWVLDALLRQGPAV